MPTRAQLEDLLRQAEFEAETLGKYLQDTRDLVADFEAAVKAQQAKVTLYRGMLAKSGTQELLTKTEVKSRVNSQKMHDQHKLAISEGQAKRDKKFKDTIRAAKPKGYTQAGLASAIGMQASLLSMCRSGERAMYLSRARRVADLTGWPADKAHWPGGIIEDA